MKKNSICKIIVSGLLAAVPLMGMAQQVCGNKPWSVRMAESEMVRCPESWQLDFQTRLKWDYCHGLELQAMLDVYDAYGDKKFFDYAVAYADTMIHQLRLISYLFYLIVHRILLFIFFILNNSMLQI